MDPVAMSRRPTSVDTAEDVAAAGTQVCRVELTVLAAVARIGVDAHAVQVLLEPPHHFARRAHRTARLERADVFEYRGDG